MTAPSPRLVSPLLFLGAVAFFCTGSWAQESGSATLAAGVPRFHSALDGRSVVVVVRHQYAPDHHSTATLFQNGEINETKFAGGSALRRITFDGGGAEVQTLLESASGVIRDPEVSFDGQHIVFSMRREKADDYHIYEIGVDGDGLRQLTFLEGVSDIDPAWLPDGGIVFSSTRDYKFCQCNRHIMANLYRCDAQGANITRVGGNTLFEGHSQVMPDGRVLYDRWEYVDRHFGPSFGLWAINPDGTGLSLIYGNNAWSPGMIADARVIPGTHQLVATFGSCHDRPWGALAIIDPSRGMDGTAPLLHTWPADLAPFLGEADVRNPSHDLSGRIDAFKGVALKYEDPFPLSADTFLCSRQIAGEQTGIYLLTTDGTEELVYWEEPGCFDPILVAPQTPPADLAERRDLAQEEGSFYVADVYRGTGMETVPRGSIRWLRVIEAPAKIGWTPTAWGIDATQAPAMNWNLTNNKRVLGTVPVEVDGSVYFKAPADRFLYFHTLDAEGRMVQSMRSGTMVRPGETVGCVGCHDQRQTSVPPGQRPLALSRPPSSLEGWYGEPRDFNYTAEVQPVFDRRCVSCHDGGLPAGEVLDLSGGLGLVFNTSYLELRGKSPLRWAPPVAGEPKPLVKAVDDGPPQVLPAYAWGSTQSRLVDVLLEGHEGIKLEPEDLDRIITWIDLNAPYYGSYYSAYPDNPFGRSPLDGGELARLSELTGVSLGAGTTGAERAGSQIDFTRPVRSRCLSTLAAAGGAEYDEALAIVRKGSLRLTHTPRADMSGFEPGPTDRARARKAAALNQSEELARAALLEGRSHREGEGEGSQN